MGRLSAWLWVALTAACSEEELPCASSGDGWLDLPQSRVAAVRAVLTAGVCDAVMPRGPCSSGECFTGKDGEQRRLIIVRGREPGLCTVTVVFADDCQAQSVEYKFGGPLDSCCADACLRQGKTSYAIDACASTP